MTEKYTLYQDAKGTWWEDCFSQPVKSVTVQAHSKKQALYLAYNGIKYDPAKRFGILPEKAEAKEPLKAEAIKYNAIRDVDITPFDREVLMTQQPECCPVCNRAWGFNE